MDYMDWARRQRLDAVQPPAEPEKSGPIEQLWCLLCGMKTLVPLCWYLFAERCERCRGAYACYNCKGRTRRGYWYRPEPSVIHNEAGLGDKL